MILQQYIQQTDLKEINIETDEDKNSELSIKNNALINAASNRINNLTKNQIEMRGFANLTIKEKTAVQKATLLLVKDWDARGISLTRINASVGVSGSGLSQSNPNEPDYINSDIIDALESANLIHLGDDFINFNNNNDCNIDLLETAVSPKLANYLKYNYVLKDKFISPDNSIVIKEIPDSKNGTILNLELSAIGANAMDKQMNNEEIPILPAPSPNPNLPIHFLIDTQQTNDPTSLKIYKWTFNDVKDSLNITQLQNDVAANTNALIEKAGRNLDNIDVANLAEIDSSDYILSIDGNTTGKISVDNFKIDMDIQANTNDINTIKTTLLSKSNINLNNVQMDSGYANKNLGFDINGHPIPVDRDSGGGGMTTNMSNSTIPNKTSPVVIEDKLVIHLLSDNSYQERSIGDFKNDIDFDGKLNNNFSNPNVDSSFFDKLLGFDSQGNSVPIDKGQGTSMNTDISNETLTVQSVIAPNDYVVFVGSNGIGFKSTVNDFKNQTGIQDNTDRVSQLESDNAVLKSITGINRKDITSSFKTRVWTYDDLGKKVWINNQQFGFILELDGQGIKTSRLGTTVSNNNYSEYYYHSNRSVDALVGHQITNNEVILLNDGNPITSFEIGEE